MMAVFAWYSFAATHFEEVSTKLYCTIFVRFRILEYQRVNPRGCVLVCRSASEK